MTLTYSKEINDVTNNDIVLKLACAIAEKLQVPYSRVTDAYGGYCNNKATNLPAAPAKKAAPAANKTANATKRMLNTTNVTSYPINLYS